MLSLVVDDDRAIRSYIRVLLQREGFETVEAAGGKAAMEIVKMLGGCVDLIVTDIQMPDGDGLSFANAVRKSFPSVPIILVSARARPDAVFEFVEKPFASATFVRVIRTLVPRPAKTA
jgi:two-component system response regulator PilR (NtrC family)